MRLSVVRQKISTVHLIWTSLFCIPSLVEAQTVASSIPDSVMEARLGTIRNAVNSFSGTKSDSIDLASFASEAFDYYTLHKDTAIGNKAAEYAFIIWNILNASRTIEEAIDHIPSDSDVWSSILMDIWQSYSGDDFRKNYKPLLLLLEERLTHPRSRSSLLMRLADYYFVSTYEPQDAIPYLERVVELDADQNDVNKARSILQELNHLNIGQFAPDFSTTTISGEDISLSKFSGKIVLLEFWSTTCGPCMPTIPHLVTLYNEFSAAKFQMIGITEDQDIDVLKGFLEEKKMMWPQIQQFVIWDNSVADLGEILKLYNVWGIPRSFLIDTDGTIHAKDLRALKLEEAVRNLVSNLE